MPSNKKMLKSNNSDGSFSNGTFHNLAITWRFWSIDGFFVVPMWISKTDMVYRGSTITRVAFALHIVVNVAISSQFWNDFLSLFCLRTDEKNTNSKKTHKSNQLIILYLHEEFRIVRMIIVSTQLQIRGMIFNATFNNISVMSCRSVFIGGGNRGT